MFDRANAERQISDAVSDDPEDLEALVPNHFLLWRPVITEPLMPGSGRYVDCRKISKMSQAYNQMIWNTRVNEYLPKWNRLPKWARKDERVLKVADLVWPVGESVRRNENKMARVTQTFPGTDGFIHSASMKTTDGVLRREAVKLAPVFYDCFRNDNRAGDIGARDRKNRKT